MIIVNLKIIFQNLVLVSDDSHEVLTKVRVFSVFREQAITPMKRTAIVLPLKLGIEQGIWLN